MTDVTKVDVTFINSKLTHIKWHLFTLREIILRWVIMIN
jgi:hypothetical protein